MIAEIAMPIGSAWLIYSEPKNPTSRILAAIIFYIWHRDGGFFAWRPKNAKKFLENAKKSGL